MTETEARKVLSELGRERWPRTRSGERDPIPSLVRRLVFERDGGCCRGCGVPLTIKTAQLDHIVPWSAEGPDTSDNLRILCKPCNETRSNFRGLLDTWTVRKPPVTIICVNCAHLDDQGNETGDPFEVTPDLVPAYCGWCGIVSPTWPEDLY